MMLESTVLLKVKISDHSPALLVDPQVVELSNCRTSKDAECPFTSTSYLVVPSFFF